MNPGVTEVNNQETPRRVRALRRLCLDTALHEDLRWGEACYVLEDGIVVEGAWLSDLAIAPPVRGHPRSLQRGVDLSQPLLALGPAGRLGRSVKQA